MGIQKVIDPDSATADRPKQATGHNVDGRIGQDVYIIGGLGLQILNNEESPDPINPASEDTLTDIKEALGIKSEEGGSNVDDLLTLIGSLENPDTGTILKILDGLAKDGSIQTLIPPVFYKSYTPSDLVEGKITAPEGVEWKQMDIYNDSESETLTFELDNTEEATFTLNAQESLVQENFSPFTEITITGTSPAFRIIVRV